MRELIERLIRRSWRVKIKDYGEVDLHVRVGDADGSGDKPCVQIEFTHQFMSNVAAVAMSGRETDALIDVLRKARKEIGPGEEARARVLSLIEEEK
jgi:hypothetical protein